MSQYGRYSDSQLMDSKLDMVENWAHCWNGNGPTQLEPCRVLCRFFPNRVAEAVWLGRQCYFRFNRPRTVPAADGAVA